MLDFNNINRFNLDNALNTNTNFFLDTNFLESKTIPVLSTTTGLFEHKMFKLTRKKTTKVKNFLLFKFYRSNALRGLRVFNGTPAICKVYKKKLLMNIPNFNKKQILQLLRTSDTLRQQTKNVKLRTTKANYTSHEHFINFEQKLLNTTWRFIGVPLFESYYWQDVNYGFKFYNLNNVKLDVTSRFIYKLSTSTSAYNKLSNLNLLFNTLKKIKQTNVANDDDDLITYKINLKPIQNDIADNWVSPNRSVENMWSTPYLFFTKSFIKISSDYYQTPFFLTLSTEFVNSVLNTSETYLPIYSINSNQPYTSLAKTNQHFIDTGRLSKLLTKINLETCEDVYLAQRITKNLINTKSNIIENETVRFVTSKLINVYPKTNKETQLSLLKTTFLKICFLTVQPTFITNYRSTYVTTNKLFNNNLFLTTSVYNTKSIQPKIKSFSKNVAHVLRQLLIKEKQSCNSINFYAWKYFWTRKLKQMDYNDRVNTEHMFTKVMNSRTCFLKFRNFFKYKSSSKNRQFELVLNKKLLLSQTLRYTTMQQKKTKTPVNLLTLVNSIVSMKFRYKPLSVKKNVPVFNYLRIFYIKKFKLQNNKNMLIKLPIWLLSKIYVRRVKQNFKHPTLLPKLLNTITYLINPTHMFTSKRLQKNTLFKSLNSTYMSTNYFTNRVQKMTYLLTSSDNHEKNIVNIYHSLSYLQWFLLKFNTYPLTTNQKQNILKAQLPLISISMISLNNPWTTFKQNCFIFNKTIDFKNSTFISTINILKKRPSFKTIYNHQFMLSSVGFYYTLLLTNQIFINSQIIRSMWQAKYSFYDSTTFKKNILKKFIATKHYYINSSLIDTLYTNPNFNFYNIRNLLTLQKKSLNKEFGNQNTPFTGNNFIEELESDKSLRIKFKPGYSTIWRRVRASFKNVFFLKFKYQHRLTNYILDRDHEVRSANINQLTRETVISTLLIRSKFATDSFWSQELLSNQFVFMNGFLVTNSTTKIIKGDFVQLLIHIKYYMVMKWQKNLTIIKKSRVTKFAQRKFKIKTARLGADRNYRYPNWLFTLRFLNTDVPSYVELDFFTLSILVISNPFLTNQYNIYKSEIFLPTVLRSYNWKYIN